jgi:hypothetical protein
MTLLVSITAYLQAQVEPSAGKWKTWFISSERNIVYHLLSTKSEIEEVFALQKALDSSA